MENRDYQPSLIWAKIETWYMARLDAQPATPYRVHDLTLYIYRTDKPGAYLLTGPKMYWQDEPMTGNYFTNCDQDALSEYADKLGEVVLWDRKLRKTTLIGITIEEALKKI